MWISLKAGKIQSGLDNKAQRNLIHEILKVSHATSQKEVIAKKWLFKYIGARSQQLYIYSYSAGWSLWQMESTCDAGCWWRYYPCWARLAKCYGEVIGCRHAWDCPPRINPWSSWGAELSSLKNRKGKKYILGFEPFNLNDLNMVNLLPIYLYEWWYPF